MLRSQVINGFQLAMFWSTTFRSGSRRRLSTVACQNLRERRWTPTSIPEPRLAGHCAKGVVLN